MKRLVLLCAALALTGCDVSQRLATIPPAPITVADRTKVDEQLGLSLTLAYTAAARAAALAIETRLVRDPATIRRIGELDRRAYAAVQGVRTAYLAGNAAGYVEALKGANAAVSELLAAAKGE